MNATRMAFLSHIIHNFNWNLSFMRFSLKQTHKYTEQQSECVFETQHTHAHKLPVNREQAKREFCFEFENRQNENMCAVNLTD